MSKYKIKGLKEGESKVFPSLRIQVSNETITDKIAERLIANGFGNEIEEVKGGKSEK